MKIKHLALVLLTIYSVIFASAQVAVNTLMPSTNFKNAYDYIPAQFTTDGKPMLSFLDFDKYIGSADIQLVNFDMSKDRHINIPENQNSMDKSIISGEVYTIFKYDTVQRDTLTSAKYIDGERYLYGKYQKYVRQCGLILPILDRVGISDEAVGTCYHFSDESLDYGLPKIFLLHDRS